MLPEEDCAVILAAILLKRKDKIVYSDNSPCQPNLTWFLKKEIYHKFLCSPDSHWQFSRVYRILHRSKIKLKGQYEEIMYYLHERILKSSSKSKLNPNIILCSYCRKEHCKSTECHLNQPGRKPEGQEGVRWNLGQAGRKHQEETPAAAVEAKEWAEALRQIITGRV